MYQQMTDELLSFIQRSPSCYHTIETASGMLRAAGFQELYEGQDWKISPGGRYFVTRNLSSLIAFVMPQGDYFGFQIAASHSESPCFKIKPMAEMTAEGQYVKLNTEKYGGMIYASWLDRPLSVAGKVVVRNGDLIESRLVNIDRDLLLIPSLAIHMNRAVNDGGALNPQSDLLPLYGDAAAQNTFWELIADCAGVHAADILGTDLFLYNRMPGSIWGKDGVYVSAPRLDDLQCAFASLKGFLAAEPAQSVPVCCIFDNEEVGSGTKQGAKSTFLLDVLTRILAAGGFGQSAFSKVLASSFMLSADNGHAVHPNYPDKADPTNRPYMNQGIVIKYNAGQKYTTDAVSEAVVKELCDSVKVPYQTYTNRSDVPGGSTLGNLSNEQVSVNTADIGLAQLAMHAAFETAGVKDTWYMAQLMQAFFASAFEAVSAGAYRLHRKNAHE